MFRLSLLARYSAVGTRSCLLVLALLTSPADALDVPPLTGRIVDLAHLLPPDLAASLSQELAEHERRTSNQIALLTLPSLEGESLEEFSHRVATTWRLGQKGMDNGVLLLVVPGDRRLRIEVGYGLEGVLTDAKSSRIIRNVIVPYFRKGDFPGGIAAGLRAIMGTIEGAYSPPETKPAEQEAESPWELFLIAVFLGVLIGGGVLQATGLGGLISGLLSFFLALPAGFWMALAAAVVAMLAALLLASLFTVQRRTRRLRRLGPHDVGWLPGGTGWSPGFSDNSPSDLFRGGGGDFGGGGASGRW